MMQRPIRGAPFSQFQNANPATRRVPVSGQAASSLPGRPVGPQPTSRSAAQPLPQIPPSTVNQAFGARRMGEQFGASGIGREGAPDLRSAQAPVQSVQSAQPRTTMGQAIRQRDQVYSLSSQRGPEATRAFTTIPLGQQTVAQPLAQNTLQPGVMDQRTLATPQQPGLKERESLYDPLAQPQMQVKQSMSTDGRRPGDSRGNRPREHQGTIDPNGAVEQQRALEGTSQPSSDPAAGDDPLAGLNPDEAAILQEAAAANQISVEEARALWDAGYRPEDYYDRSGNKGYDTSWYQYMGNSEDRGREIGFDADEGGRKMAQNLLAERNRQRQDTEEGEAQDEFDRAIQDILDMDGPDVSRALDAARQARELAAGRQMRSFYSSSMDPRAMQAMGADFNENVASVGAAQDAQIQLQSEMQKYASQIAALQAAASLAGNVAQTARINNLSIGLQERLAALARENALFERNLSTPSAEEILASMGTTVAGGVAQAGVGLGLKKILRM
jgi:hypothetical protein